MNVLTYVFPALFFCILPLSACLLFDKYKRHFHGAGVLIPILLYSLLSWGTVNGFIFLRYCLDPMSLRGPEGAFALFFGWLYLWIASVPVFLLYGVGGTMYAMKVKKEPAGSRQA